MNALFLHQYGLARGIMFSTCLSDLPFVRSFVCYLRQRRSYMFLPVFVCLSVCLSVSKITQKRVDGFG